MKDTTLDSLDVRFKPKAIELIARLIEAKIPVLIVNTGRTEAEHQADLASGHSWIAHSKHQDGLAIDICPYEMYQLHGPDKLDWDSADPIWQQIGLIGEDLNLGWGGRWAKKDMGHFEYKS